MADRKRSRRGRKKAQNSLQSSQVRCNCQERFEQTRDRQGGRNVRGKNHRDFDAFVLILMSHGGDRDHILGVDERETTVKNLMVEFQANKCPSLKGKPKVFIIQTCRGLINNTTETFLSSIGSIYAVSAQMDNSTFADPFSLDSTLPRSEFPREADFLLAFATVPGYVAFRSPESSTFFIQVCLMFLLYAQHISESEG